MDTGSLRPTVVEVSLARLAENFRAIQAAVAPAAVMPIVKANAYGHGLVPVARHLVALGARSLGVAFLEEAVALREAGVTVPDPGHGRHLRRPDPDLPAPRARR